MEDFQSWNPRSKRWVLFRDGRYHDTDTDKFSGVPVKKDKPGGDPAPPEPEPADPADPPTKPEPEDDDENPWALW